MSGFIKLNRNIEGTWIHKDERYFKAWCTILFNVNWKPANVVIGSKTLYCDVNEALFSLDTWAKKFGNGWDKDKVRRFFKRLELHHLIVTISATKTTRLKVLVSSDCEEIPNDNRTISTTRTARTPHPIEEVRSKEVKNVTEDSNESNASPLKFQSEFEDIVSHFQEVTKKTLKIPNAKTALSTYQHYKDIRARLNKGAKVEDVKKVISFMCNKWQADNYMKKYRRISTLVGEKYDEYLEEIINDKVTDEHQPETLNLKAYYLQYFREVDLKHAIKDGSFERWTKELEENKFRLGNIAKAYKNKTFTTLLLFELSYMALGRKLTGSTPQRKIESFQRWYSKLSDYDQAQGDIRELLKANKN